MMPEAHVGEAARCAPRRCMERHAPGSMFRRVTRAAYAPPRSWRHRARRQLRAVERAECRQEGSAACSTPQCHAIVAAPY